jgi:hypothetical protein
VIVSSNVEECLAKVLEFEERARTARLPDLKRLYEELARQLRSMAEMWRCIERPTYPDRGERWTGD